jgi:hypothetical protein
LAMASSAFDVYCAVIQNSIATPPLFISQPFPYPDTHPQVI